MQPSRFDLNGIPLWHYIVVVDPQEPVHLRFNMLGRTVLMDDSVGPPGVVRSDLPGALAFERHPYSPELSADNGQPRHHLLVPGQQRVPTLETAWGDPAPISHVLPDHLARRGLVLQPALDGLVVNALKRVRADHASVAFGDQLLGHTPLERIQPFDLPGLDGERTVPLRQPSLDDRSAAR
ncbi:MAG: hypothetical protein OXH15_16615 [Gammaproteobacteria bacterium]|nr:hypothetical protein [Gammaproteobacteria bacterium]